MILKSLKMTKFGKVIGENEARISTIDMLRHIELWMEILNQKMGSLRCHVVSESNGNVFTHHLSLG